MTYQKQPSMYPDAKPGTFEQGLEFQDFCRPLLLKYGIIAAYYTSKKYQIKEGESVFGVEIKLDNLCTKTKRMSIEIAEKSRAANYKFVPSGIMRPDNTWLYVQGNFEIVYVFSKKFLVNLYNSKKPDINTRPTIQTFYLSLVDADKYSLLTINPNAGESIKEKAA